MSKLQKNLINNMLEKITQVEKDFPSRAIYRCLKLLNVPVPLIRRALIAVNEVRVQDLTDDTVSSSSLYNALNPKNGRTTDKAMEKLAEACGIDISLFWDDVYKLAA